jgi:hypothetical protein
VPKMASRNRARQSGAPRDASAFVGEQLYELAKHENIAGRSRMGKWELIGTSRRARGSA